MVVQLNETLLVGATATAMPNVLEGIVGQVAAVSPEAGVVLVSEEAGMLRLLAAAGSVRQAVSPTAWEAAQLPPAPETQVLTDDKLAAHPARTLFPGAAAVVSVPVEAVTEGQILGWLWIGSGGDRLRDRLPLYQMAARQIALELDRQEVQQALARTRETQRRVERQLAGGDWVVDPDTTEVTFSEPAGQILGRGEGEGGTISWESLLSYFHVEDRRVFWRHAQAALREHLPLEFAVRLAPEVPSCGVVRIWGEPVVEGGVLVRYEGVIQRLTQPDRDRLVAPGLGQELRSGIGSLKELAAWLVQEQPEGTPAEGTQMLHLSAQYLSNLYDFAVDPVSMAPRELKLTERAFNIRDLLYETHKTLSGNTHGKKLDFDLVVEQDIPEYIVGDPQWLEYILKTLALNAFLFTKKGYVKIIVDVLYQSDRELVLEFTVVDSGVGISEDGQIFLDMLPTEGLSRQSPLKARVMGLELANRLIDLQQGALHINSTPNEGTEFYFKLKFGKATYGKYGRPKEGL